MLCVRRLVWADRLCKTVLLTLVPLIAVEEVTGLLFFFVWMCPPSSTVHLHSTRDRSITRSFDQTLDLPATSTGHTVFSSFVRKTREVIGMVR